VGQQSDLADRGVERATHPIIEVNGVKIGRRLAGNRVAVAASNSLPSASWT